jgi:hypothetical protein
MGDFNIKLPHTAQPDVYDPWCVSLQELIRMYDLCVWNLEPFTKGLYTRVPENPAQRPAIIDYIISTMGGLEVKEVWVDEARLIGIESDHVPILARVEIANAIPINVDIVPAGWRRRKVDWNAYKLCILESMGEFKEVYNFSTVQEQYHSMILFLKEVGERAIGRISTKPRSFHEPVNLKNARQELRLLRHRLWKHSVLCFERDCAFCPKLKDHIWRKRCEVRDLEGWYEYARIENLTNHLVFGASGMMAIYRYVNGRVRQPRRKFVLRDNDGSLVLDPERIRMLLQMQWHQIYNVQYWPYANGPENIWDLRIPRQDAENMIADISSQELDTAIKQLHAGTSSGVTDVMPEMIIHTPPEFKRLLLQWCNDQLHSGQISAATEITRSVFLHKKGTTDDLGNYRTLTTGCNICKVFLRVLCNRITYVAEQHNLLGQIQNGFRQGRRAVDNLLILQTLIAKSRRAKSELRIALLDIKKAYDRVDRDILWRKLYMYGMDPRFITILQQVYANPRSRLLFQGVETDPLPMPIGLRQGCVLSPILFALYLADLGRSLEMSGLGVLVNGTRIPGMFFADDMILCGNDKHLTEILDIVSTFADRNKIEFSGPKSVVLAFGRNVAKCPEAWNLGHVPQEGSEHLYVQMSTGKKGKYLGVEYSASRNIFHTHYETMVAKAQRSAGVLSILLKDVNYPIKLMAKVWSLYAVPTCMYGMEVIHITAAQLQKLEKVQKGFVKRVLGLPITTPNAAVYMLSGLQQLAVVAQKHKLNYFRYVYNTSPERWVHQAYLEQKSWMVSDGVIDHHENILTTDVKGARYWLLDVVDTLSEWGIARLSPIAKNDVKQLCVRTHWDYVLNQIATHSSVENMDECMWEIDQYYHCRRHYWWLRGRVGSILLNKTREHAVHGIMCPMCRQEEETLGHFLSCPRYKGTLHEEWYFMLYDLRWWFSWHRSDEERSRISRYIGHRWTERRTVVEPREERVNID